LVPVLRTAAKTGSFLGHAVPTPGGNSDDQDSLKNPWRPAAERVGLSALPRTHHFRHCWKTNAILSSLDKDIRDAIVGHGNKKKFPSSVYLSVSDEDLVRETDRLTFDHGKTEIWGQK